MASRIPLHSAGMMWFRERGYQMTGFEVPEKQYYIDLFYFDQETIIE